MKKALVGTNPLENFNRHNSIIIISIYINLSIGNPIKYKNL